MFVEFAQAFLDQGYPVFRFDLRGCGDSSGLDAKGDMQQDLADASNAIKYFLQLAHLQNVKVLGISRGARVAYNLLQEETLPLSGLMLLSTPCSSRQVAMKNVGSALNQYGLKLFKPHYWLKLLRGRVSVAGVTRTIKHAWNISKRYEETQDSKKANCPLLFMYGQSDPICVEALQYYQQRCGCMDFESHIIAGANHSFFHYRWKEEILELCLMWLEKVDRRSGDV